MVDNYASAGLILRSTAGWTDEEIAQGASRTGQALAGAARRWTTFMHHVSLRLTPWSTAGWTEEEIAQAPTKGEDSPGRGGQNVDSYASAGLIL